MTAVMTDYFTKSFPSLMSIRDQTEVFRSCPQSQRMIDIMREDGPLGLTKEVGHDVTVIVNVVVTCYFDTFPRFDLLPSQILTTPQFHIHLQIFSNAFIILYT